MEGVPTGSQLPAGVVNPSPRLPTGASLFPSGGSGEPAAPSSHHQVGLPTGEQMRAPCTARGASSASGPAGAQGELRQTSPAGGGAKDVASNPPQLVGQNLAAPPSVRPPPISLLSVDVCGPRGSRPPPPFTHHRSIEQASPPAESHTIGMGIRSAMWQMPVVSSPGGCGVGTAASNGDTFTFSPPAFVKVPVPPPLEWAPPASGPKATGSRRPPLLPFRQDGAAAVCAALQPSSLPLPPLFEAKRGHHEQRLELPLEALVGVVRFLLGPVQAKPGFGTGSGLYHPIHRYKSPDLNPNQSFPSLETRFESRMPLYHIQACVSSLTPPPEPPP
ncbi:extensin-like [Nymphaea colorata]|uniref:extensin-like n=1 Tax=Nymphaea colorata TaxID=210225 RepID=UPI00129EE3CC|nr:extensin-like [Nymphaea colorata]